MIEMPAEFAQLKGGSNLFVWDSAISSFEPTVSIVAREMTGDIIATNVAGNVTEYAADTDGDVIDEDNVNGTSVIDAAEGIATITVKASTGKDELKEGWYVIKATAAATVDIYAMSSSNFARGTDEAYEDDDGKITASPITVPASGATVDVDNFGLTLTGGSSSAIAMTTDDTAKFYVQKPHGGSYSAIIGEQPMDFQEYGMTIFSETNAGTLYNMLLYRVKPAGMSFPFPEKNYGEFNVNVQVMYDSTENRIGIFSNTTPE